MSPTNLREISQKFHSYQCEMNMKSAQDLQLVGEK